LYQYIFIKVLKIQKCSRFFLIDAPPPSSDENEDGIEEALVSDDVPLPPSSDRVNRKVANCCFD
jgi:hypothetical protein